VGYVPCGAGSVSAPGDSACTPCSPGTYSSEPGTSNCTLCAPGHHASLPGSTSCAACPGGLLAVTPGQAVCCRPLDLCERLADTDLPSPYNPATSDCSNRVNQPTGTPCRASNISACQQPVTCSGAVGTCDLTAEVQSIVRVDHIVFQPASGLYYTSSVRVCVWTGSGPHCTHHPSHHPLPPLVHSRSVAQLRVA
jgi:hypothetical protein